MVLYCFAGNLPPLNFQRVGSRWKGRRYRGWNIVNAAICCYVGFFYAHQLRLSSPAQRKRICILTIFFATVLWYRTKSRIWLHNWSVNDRLATFLECAQAELFQFLRRLCRQIHGNSAIEITVGKKEIHLKSANKIQSLAASRFNCFTHAHAPAIWHSIRNWIHEPFSASHSFMFRIKFPTISKFVQYLVCWTFWCIILLTFKWYQINILQHKLLCNHLKREVWF